MRKLLTTLLLALATGTAVLAQEPIAVERASVNYSATMSSFQVPQYAYGNCEIANTSQAVLSNVTVTIKMLDGEGHALDSAAVHKQAGTLQPGQDYEFDWTWYNNTAVGDIEPEVIVSGDAGGQSFQVVHKPKVTPESNPLNY